MSNHSQDSTQGPQQSTSDMSTQLQPADILTAASAQVKARDRLGADSLPEFARALDHCTIGNLVIDKVLECFGYLVHSATNYWLSTGSSGLIQSALTDHLQSIMLGHQIYVSLGFIDSWLQERQALAQIDIHSTYHLLLHDARAFMTSSSGRVSVGDLHWHMFRKFVRGVLHTASTHGPTCLVLACTSLSTFGLAGFFDVSATPIAGWTWDSFNPDMFTMEYYDFEDYDQDDDDDDEVDINDLPDVCFDAVGPALKVEHHALAAAYASELPAEPCPICLEAMHGGETVRDEVPVKTTCGHAFHYGCLGTLINGLAKFSNLCPYCRGKICPQREKRLKGSSKIAGEDESRGSTGEVVAASGRDLQDTQGDVVMTDS